MATITTVRQRFVDILEDYKATLPKPYRDKAKVHRYIPRQFNDAELPAFVVFPADATNRKPSSDVKENSRLYLVRCYVAPLAQGISNEIEEYAEAWLDDFGLLIDQKPRLENSDNEPLSEVKQNGVTQEGDGGMVSAQYPLDGGNAYLMLEWRIRVQTKKTGIT